MQSFDTETSNTVNSSRSDQALILGRAEDWPVGSCKTIELPDGRELALCNVGGEFYAIVGRVVGQTFLSV